MGNPKPAFRENRRCSQSDLVRQSCHLANPRDARRGLSFNFNRDSHLLVDVSIHSAQTNEHRQPNGPRLSEGEKGRKPFSMVAFQERLPILPFVCLSRNPSPRTPHKNRQPREKPFSYLRLHRLANKGLRRTHIAIHTFIVIRDTRQNTAKWRQ
jgi:hypothetical protein